MARFSVGDTVSNAFGIVFHNYGVYLVAMGPFIALIGLLSIGVTIFVLGPFLGTVAALAASPGAGSARAFQALAAVLVPTLLLLVATYFVGVFANFFGVVATDGILRGQRLGLGQCWERAGPRFANFFATGLLVIVIPLGVVVGVAVAMILAGVGAAAGGGGAAALVALALVVLVVGVIVVLYLLLRWYVAPVAAVLEVRGVTENLARSTELTQASRLGILGLLIVLALVNGLLGFVVALPVSLAEISSSGLQGARVPSLTSLIGQQVAATIVSLVMTPVFVAASVLVYRALSIPPPAFAPPAPVPGSPCPSCGAWVQAGNRFCTACGTQLPAGPG